MTHHVNYEVVVKKIQGFNIWHVGHDSQEICARKFMTSAQGKPFEIAKAGNQRQDGFWFYFGSILQDEE